VKRLRRYHRKLGNYRKKLVERYLRKYVFIHINKTGGMSIAHALGLQQEHVPALEKRRRLGEKPWAEKFTFAVVRNPWDRVLSQYAYRIQAGKLGDATQAVDFDTWVRRAYQEKDPLICAEALMFSPQLHWLVDENGRIIVDHVARFENLGREFEMICNKIGVTASLPRLNISAHRPYREVYSSASAKIVAEYFQPEIEVFKYRF